MLTIVPIQSDLNTVELKEPRTSIGAHDSNTLIIKSASVSDFHAEFHLNNNEVVLIDLDSEFGTTLNGDRISGRVKVKDGDIVTVGETELKIVDSDYESENQQSKNKVLKEPGPDSNATVIRNDVSGWRLIAKTESLLSGEFPIENVMIVGRDEECDLSIPVSHISRQHAQFEITAGNLKLKDLNSTNGTSVNGEKITEIELQTGDTVCFDKEEFLILGPVKQESAVTDKTLIREPVSDVKAVEDNKKKGKIADDYVVISEGVTEIGETWKNSNSQANASTNSPDVMLTDEAKANNKTVIMPPADVSPDCIDSMSKVDNEVMATLECTTEPLLGLKLDLLKKINSIGRTENNDIEINESSVSSKHAQIVYKNGSFFIRDLDSYNGTFVNNKRYDLKTLKNGDVIGLGRVQLIFSNQVSDGGVFERIKRLLSGIKISGLFLKTVALLALVSIVSVLTYNFIPKYEFGHADELSLDWVNLSSIRINPTQPVLYDMNNDGIDDVIIVSENRIVDIVDGDNGLKLSSIELDFSPYASPLLIDVQSDKKMDIVNVSSNGEVVANDVNGNRLWSNNDMQGQLLIAQAVAVKINEDNVKDIIVPSQKDGILILDGETGNQLLQLKEINGAIVTRPIVQDVNHDGVTDIVVVTDTNKIIAFSVQSPTIRKLWERNVPPVLTAPLKYDQIKNHGVIFVATQNAGVLALNSFTGNKIWQSQINDLLLSGPVLVDSDADNINDTVIQVTFSGNVVALGMTQGNQIWDLKLPNKLQAEPVVLNKIANDSSELLFVDTEGEAHTVSIKNGDVISRTKIEKANRFVVSPVLRNGTLKDSAALIFTSQNGNVFSYEIGKRKE